MSINYKGTFATMVTKLTRRITLKDIDIKLMRPGPSFQTLINADQKELMGTESGPFLGQSIDQSIDHILVYRQESNLIIPCWSALLLAEWALS